MLKNTDEVIKSLASMDSANSTTSCIVLLSKAPDLSKAQGSISVYLTEILRPFGLRMTILFLLFATMNSANNYFSFGHVERSETSRLIWL